MESIDTTSRVYALLLYIERVCLALDLIYYICVVEGLYSSKVHSSL